MHRKNKKFALGQPILCFERRYIHKSENNSQRSEKTILVSDLDFLLAILHFSKKIKLVKRLFD
jgi:hypothetical protein